MNTVVVSRDDPERSASDPLRASFGPISLIMVAVWLLSVAAWNIAPARPVPEAVAAQFTDLGRKYYLPEYDIPVYLGGLAAAVLGGVAVGFGWHRRWERATGGSARSRLERQGKRHLFWAVGCLAVALAAPQSFMLNVLLSAFAICASVVLWFNSRPRAGGQRANRPSTAATSSSTSSVVRASKEIEKETRNVASGPVTTGAGASKVSDRAFPGFWLATAAAAFIIALLVYVPNPDSLEASTWKLDYLMHWNYYLMGPLIAFRHGAALGTDFYTQYSVGWPLFFSALDQILSVNMRVIFEAVTLWGCLYFLMVFWFLRSLTGRTAWAITGLLLALFLQLYCGTDGPLWMYPSSTILRNPLDVPLFWLCLLHARSGQSKVGLGIGAVAGLAVLFGTDTGVYSTAALVFYCGLCFGYRADGKPLLTGPFLLATGGAFIAVVIAGLSWASRGTLFTRAFWLGYWESLLFYSGGISALPMHDGIAQREDFLLLMVALLVYTFALCSALLRWITQTLTAPDLVLALVAAFGLETLMVFINRSHPFNLYHPIIPFCLLAIAYVARWAETPPDPRSRSRFVQSGGRIARAAAPAALAAILIAGFALNPHVREYPSLLAKALPQPAAGRTRSSLRAEEDYKEVLRPFADALQSVSENGRYSVALFDPKDTNFLVLADIAPYCRYSPLDPLHYRQIELIRQRLTEAPPDIILFTIYTTFELEELRTELLGETYQLDGTTGPWQILRRVDRETARVSSG